MTITLLQGLSAFGNEELPLNVLCNNEASEIQGDDNAIGMTSAQDGGSIIPEPYENLVDEVSMQSVLRGESAHISDARVPSVMEM